jgi:outer membrane receptor protein involved in Fe transport
MPRPPLLRAAAQFRRLLVAGVLASLLLVNLRAQATDLRNFDIPGQAAARALKLFSEQSGRTLIADGELLRGLQTNRIKGEMAPQAAIERMLAGTGLAAAFDPQSGGFAVKRVADPKEPRAVAVSVAAPVLTPPVDRQETVVLSPFEVRTDLDQGFVATTSLAGGRLAGRLQDTPTAYSVLTSEFLEALNLTDVESATQWTTGATLQDDDGRNFIYGSSNAPRIGLRGVSANGAQRNFFGTAGNYDNYNTARLDFARGPNAILFGTGSFGGTTNIVTKEALLNKLSHSLRFTQSSWHGHRTTVDANQPLTAKTAVRFNLLKQEKGGWRDNERDDRLGAHLTGTWEATPALRLRGEIEWANLQKTVPMTSSQDYFAGWDGVSVFSSPLNSLPANASQLGISRQGNLTAPQPTVIPAVNGNKIYNMGGTAITQGANATAEVPVAGQLVVGPSANLATGPIKNGLNVPAGWFDRALAGSKFRFPSRSFSTALDEPGFIQSYRVMSAFANYQWREKFFGELAGSFSRNGADREYITVRQLQRIQIDINRNLPDGTPNPNFLEPFSEAPRTRFQGITENAEGRLAAAYVFDKNRLGSFRINAMAGQRWTDYQTRVWVYTLLRNPDSRGWANSSNVKYRYYWNVNQPGNRPLGDLSGPQTYMVGNTRETYDASWVLDIEDPTSIRTDYSWLRYAQAALNGKLLNDRLHLIGAVRRDDYHQQTRSALFSRWDYPLGYDAVTPLRRPGAPADYLKLTYVPKDAAGNPTGPARPAEVRPRDGNERALAQYASDRFQSDYSAPDTDQGMTTRTAGGVFHATPWLSVFANYAESFNPAGAGVDIKGRPFDFQTAKGYDYGLRFSFLQGRLQAILGRYKSTENNNPVATGGSAGLVTGLGIAINEVIDANVIGDQSTAGKNRRGFPNIPQAYNDRRDRESEGYEFEAVANLTSRWRLLANVATPRAYQSNAYTDTRAYLKENDAILRQILEDGGVKIDANNSAYVDPAVPINQRTPDAAAAALAWNNLQVILNSFLTGRQRITRLVETTANVFTDYRFAEGWLRGVRVGGGFNYRGREIIGYRGADTIVSPTNPRLAIDDPNASPTDPVFRQPYTIAIASLGYERRVGRSLRLSLDLKVENLFNQDPVLYYNTALRPPGGDLTTPARVATPYQFSLLAPRNYTLTASLRF